MNKWLAIMMALALAMVALPSTAVADDEPQETVYDFEGEDLEGAILRPHGEDIHGDQRGQTSSLINIREDFIPEMLESVETL